MSAADDIMAAAEQAANARDSLAEAVDVVGDAVQLVRAFADADPCYEPLLRAQLNANLGGAVADLESAQEAMLRVIRALDRQYA